MGGKDTYIRRPYKNACYIRQTELYQVYTCLPKSRNYYQMRKVKTTAQTFIRAIKKVVFTEKTEQEKKSESLELACPPPLQRTDTHMIATHEITGLAARNIYSAHAPLTDGTADLSSRGPLLLPRSATSSADPRRQNESSEWASLLYRRSGSGRTLLS